VNPLQDQIVHREVITGHDGASGARLERVRLRDGRHLILKRLDPELDLSMRVTDDPIGREFALWRGGVLHALPAGLGHAVVGGWPEATGSTLLMRDVGTHLVRGRISRPQCRRILAAAGALHRAYAGTNIVGACRPAIRMGLFAPAVMTAYAEGDNPLPRTILKGWAAFADQVPNDVADPVFAILDRPELLADPLTAVGTTLIHGDLWLSNVALEPAGVVLLDWALATVIAPAVEFASFLAGNASQVDGATLDDLVADVRVASGPLHDEPALRLALLGGLVEMGWNLALRARTPGPTGGELAWWVAQARAALDVGLDPTAPPVRGPGRPAARR
jgi:hypothetical protein